MKELDRYILIIDQSTTGKMGQVISTTKIKIVCSECNDNSWWTNYNNYKRKESDKPTCQACKNKLGISGMKNKKHSIETIKKFSDGRRAGVNNVSKRKDVKEKISKKLKGRDAYWLKGKKRPEHAKKMSELMKNVWNSNNEFRNDYREKLINNFESTHSSLHTEIKEWLEKNEIIDFKSEQIINGTNFIVDELNQDKNIIIEVYGDFWHCNPKIYKKNEKINHPGKPKLVNEVWAYDIMREKELKKLGYDIFVIWEEEFKNNKENLLIKIKKVYEKK